MAMHSIMMMAISHHHNNFKDKENYTINFEEDNFLLIKYK